MPPLGEHYSRCPAAPCWQATAGFQPPPDKAIILRGHPPSLDVERTGFRGNGACFNGMTVVFKTLHSANSSPTTAVWDFLMFPCLDLFFVRICANCIPRQLPGQLLVENCPRRRGAQQLLSPFPSRIIGRPRERGHRYHQ